MANVPDSELTTNTAIRRARSAYTRLNLNRLLRLEPDNFDSLYRTKLKNVEGWRYRQDLALLYALARDIDVAGVALEIGSFKGLATIALAAGCKEGNHGMVHTVDPHTGDRQDLEAHGSSNRSSLNDFVNNIERANVQDQIVYHVMTSDELVLNWKSGHLRMLFIDGWHSYKAVTSDITNWAPKLAPDGVVLIDDYENYGEVRSAVNDHLQYLPPNFVRAGRMAMFYNKQLPASANRQLRLSWG